MADVNNNHHPDSMTASASCTIPDHPSLANNNTSMANNGGDSERVIDGSRVQVESPGCTGSVTESYGQFSNNNSTVPSDCIQVATNGDNPKPGETLMESGQPGQSQANISRKAESYQQQSLNNNSTIHPSGNLPAAMSEGKDPAADPARVSGTETKGTTVAGYGVMICDNNNLHAVTAMEQYKGKSFEVRYDKSVFVDNYHAVVDDSALCARGDHLYNNLYIIHVHGVPKSTQSKDFALV